MMAIENILTEISPLKPVEKLQLIDEILTSLNQLNPQVDKLWEEEAEERIKAFESGNISSISADKVFEKYQE